MGQFKPSMKFMQGDGRGLGLRMKMGTRAVLSCECQDKVYRVYLGYNGEPLKVTEQGRQMIKRKTSKEMEEKLALIESLLWSRHSAS